MYSSTQDFTAEETGLLVPKDAPRVINWCGSATTSSPDPSKQTVGYSGRCSQGTGDYYTKYKDLATQICNRA